MPDDVGVLPSFEPEAVDVATDEVGARHYQWIKLAFGADGVATPVTDTDGERLPVDSPTLEASLATLDASVGSVDTSIGGLDTLLTSIDALLTARLPAALIQSGLKTGSVDVVLTAKVVNGATVQANGVDLAGLRNWCLFVPSTFDGTQIQFQMCDTYAGTYGPVRDITNTRVVMTVTAGSYHDIPGELMAARFLKIECLTAQAATDTDFLIIGKS